MSLLNPFVTRCTPWQTVTLHDKSLRKLGRASHNANDGMIRVEWLWNGRFSNAWPDHRLYLIPDAFEPPADIVLSTSYAFSACSATPPLRAAERTYDVFCDGDHRLGMLLVDRNRITWLADPESMAWDSSWHYLTLTPRAAQDIARASRDPLHLLAGDDRGVRPGPAADVTLLRAA